MVSLVTDASVLSSFFLDEKSGLEVQRMIEENARFYAPLFWKYEVANAIWKRKDIPLAVAQSIIEQMWHFIIYGDEPTHWLNETFAVARMHNITFYDSAYIVMAKVYNIPLWTFDNVQAHTALKTGVSLWDSKE